MIRFLPKEVGDRMPFMLRVLGICWCIQIVIGTLMVSDFVPDNEHSEDDVK